jgi:hypothetical protein
MPSVTDVQQPTLTTNAHGKSTPPPSTTASNDPTSTDPITQAVLVLEKKQRNLGKRKEKLEGYEQEAKSGKELHKDQKEALAKYSDVLGQIDCVKELTEQLKKIQSESIKNQKRLSKQAAEDKRQLVSQRLREYAQIRYLVEHRSTLNLKPEESSLLDDLSSLIIPSDNSSNSISRSVDTVLSIYQGGQSTIKNITGKTPQELRVLFDELIKNFDTQSTVISPPPAPVAQPAPSSSSSEQEQIKGVDQTNDISSLNRDLPEPPLQFDTRNQTIPIEQIIQNSQFFPIDLNTQVHENPQDQSNDPTQYLQTFTVDNSNINNQPSSTSIENQPKDDEQQTDDQWQQPRGNANTRGQYNNGNRGYNRGGTNNYNQHRRGGPRGGGGGGWYDNPYGGNQRQYNDNNRGRGGSRGNRGGGNYRGGNRGYNNNNVNGYQKPAQYHQVHSAPPTQQ